MSDDNMNDKPSDDKSAKHQTPETDESGKWSTGAKFGAAIGSAAVAAALMYAGRHQMKKHDGLKRAQGQALPKYENEPDYDDDDSDDLIANSEEE